MRNLALAVWSSKSLQRWVDVCDILPSVCCASEIESREVHSSFYLSAVANCGLAREVYRILLSHQQFVEG